MFKQGKVLITEDTMKNTTSMTNLSEESMNNGLQNETDFKQEPILTGTNDEHVENEFIDDNFAGLVQASSDALVIELNRHLAGLIHDAELDPLVDVFSDS